MEVTPGGPAEGAEADRDYPIDMKTLQDLTSHGGDPFLTSNVFGALSVQEKENSMTEMGNGRVPSLYRFCAPTILALGGKHSWVPKWPVACRKGPSAVRQPLTLQ